METTLPQPVPPSAADLVAGTPGQALPTPRRRRVRDWLGRRERTDALAPRYSRFIEIVKFVLPVTAAALVVLVFAYSMFTRTPKTFTLSFADLAALGGDRIVTNPTLTYTNEDNHAFIVKAKRAKQLEGQDNLWRLEDIRGRMNKPASLGYNLTSTRGVLDTKSEVIDLAGKVVVVSDDGYKFRATSAQVDMKAGRVTSESAVRGEGPTGSIEAESFELRDRGEQLSFVGNVHFRARPKTGKDE